jgi:2-dehydropantoate 2-reductase
MMHPINQDGTAMKICIFGAGAVAGLAGARMVRGGVTEMTFVARGAHLAAMQANGLTVREPSDEWTVPVDATDDTAALGEQDIVILGLKAHTVSAALPQITPLIGEKTVVVHMVNGIPWWYPHGLGGGGQEMTLECVDPGGRIRQTIGAEKALGCVVYIACNIPEPGVIEHNRGRASYIVGEPDGSRSERAKSVARLFDAGGLDHEISKDIRGVVWDKLWGNLTGNPMSLLCEAPCDAMALDPEVRRVMGAMIAEAHTAARASGAAVDVDIDAKLDTFERLGPIKTSMLQDFEAGKTIELDALLGVITELGRNAGIETPTCDLVYALTRMKAATAGCYAPPGG